MNSKLLHLFGFNTYEYSVNIKAFGFSQLTENRSLFPKNNIRQMTAIPP
jgi:hypothetical protein